MMKRERRVLSCGIGLALLVSAVAIGATGPSPLGWVDMEGFRGLPWGSTVEKAKAVFPDLTFARYAVTEQWEMPSSVYKRKHEDTVIDGIRFDEISYWFRNGSFYGITATLGSLVGPRTLGTPASGGFDRLKGKFDRFAGPPVDDRTKTEPWGGNRKGVWRRGDLSLVLSFFEPPGVNGEDLVLRITKGTAPKSREPE